MGFSNNVLSQKRGILAMCGCFFGEYSNFSANEGCLTYFFVKQKLLNREFFNLSKQQLKDPIFR